MDNKEIQNKLRVISEDYVLCLFSQHKMHPSEIVMQYTGREDKFATMHDAINCVIAFNMDSVQKYGFLAA